MLFYGGTFLQYKKICEQISLAMCTCAQNFYVIVHMRISLVSTKKPARLYYFFKVNLI